MPQPKIPVALFVYNRPCTTLRTLDAIRLYQPSKLFIISDGPKLFTEDSSLIATVRDVCSTVDWPCDVMRLYRERNLGCRSSVATGLSWVFGHVDQAIILEDDCLPDLSFFYFCSELLNKYKDDRRVMTIGGHRAEPIDSQSSHSYYFSKYPATWGWATWRRSFVKYSVDLAGWSNNEIRWLTQHLGSETYSRYWAHLFNKSKQGANDWDYAWAFHCWKNNGVAIRPSISLVQNIGFGPDATHTKEVDHPFGQIKSGIIQLPLNHPDHLDIDQVLEAKIEDVLYSGMRRKQLNMLRLIARYNRSQKADK